MQLLKETSKYRKLFRTRIYSTNSISTEEHTCLNCGNTYKGNFCNQCGQNHTVSRITFRKIINNALNGFTNIDRGFFYTLLGLCLYPGSLIRDYISGKRIYYFHPFQMLFILGAIYGLLVSLFGDEDKIDFSTIILNMELNIDMHGHEDVIKEKIITLIQILRNWLNGNIALRTILMIPIYVIATRWAFCRRIKEEHFNIAELFYLRAFVSCQILFCSLLYLPFCGFNSDGFPFWMEVLLTYWIYCCFFPRHWIKNIFSTLLIFVYSFTILFFIAIILGFSAGLYIRYIL